MITFILLTRYFWTGKDIGTISMFYEYNETETSGLSWCKSKQK